MQLLSVFLLFPVSLFGFCQCDRHERVSFFLSGFVQIKIKVTVTFCSSHFPLFCNHLEILYFKLNAKDKLLFLARNKSKRRSIKKRANKKLCRRKRGKEQWKVVGDASDDILAFNKRSAFYSENVVGILYILFVSAGQEQKSKDRFHQSKINNSRQKGEIFFIFTSQIAPQASRTFLFFIFFFLRFDLTFSFSLVLCNAIVVACDSQFVRCLFSYCGDIFRFSFEAIAFDGGAVASPTPTTSANSNKTHTWQGGIRQKKK